MKLKLILVRERNPAYRVREPIASPREAAIRLGPIIADEAQEVFMAVVVDGRNRYSGHYEVSRGTLTSSMVHPREVFKQAILRNASALFLFHNHPSGDPTPSEEDIAVTKRLVKAGELLGIPRARPHHLGGGRQVHLAAGGFVLLTVAAYGSRMIESSVSRHSSPV